MEAKYIVVMITTPDGDTARLVGEALLEKRLAACVNILPTIQSLYWWKGAIHHDDEVLLIAKTRADLFEEQVIPAVKSAHPYTTPEIIALPILMGSVDYLDWIEQETT